MAFRGCHLTGLIAIMSNQLADTFGSDGRQEFAKTLTPPLLVALTTMFGLQMLRLLITDLAVYLRQIKEVDIALLGLISLSVFLTGFLAPIIARVLSRRNAVIVTGISRARPASSVTLSRCFSTYTAPATKNKVIFMKAWAAM